MNTLYLAWQNVQQHSRRWYPIGRLEADWAQSIFRFDYTNGALTAEKDCGFEPLLSFPSFEKHYESAELFPLFQNRLLSPKRPDFKEYLGYLDLDPAKATPGDILAVTGGVRLTDTLDVFPKMETDVTGAFNCRFFLHGTSHIHSIGAETIEKLKPEQELVVSMELNNPVTRVALQISTRDYVMIGWTPRYLVADLTRAIANSHTAITAKVVKVNPAPAPAKQRVLIEFSGHFPVGQRPMETEDFAPVSG